MKPLHEIQIGILKKLLFAEDLRYTDLKPKHDIENNQLQFHLDKLIENGWIEKVEDRYRLTNSGKENANRMDSDNQKMIKQAKIGVINVCYRESNGEREYLIYTRLKHPFFGMQGFASGKIAYGESIYETSVRELKEETNLEGNPELYAIRHHRVYNNKDEILEDKFFYFMRIINPIGEVVANDEGKQEWVKEKELLVYLKNPVYDFWDNMETLNNFKGQIDFKELEVKSEEF